MGGFIEVEGEGKMSWFDSLYILYNNNNSNNNNNLFFKKMVRYGSTRFV